MASLQARSPLRSAQPLIFLNKIVSLILFIILFGAGWVVLSYVKTGMVASDNTGQTSSPAIMDAAANSAQINHSDSPEINRLSMPVRLVYSCAGENESYHTSAHLPSKCEQSALSEEAALRRGLKPCRVCMPE